MIDNIMIIGSIIAIAIGTYLTRATPLFFNIENMLGEERKHLLRKFFYLMGAAIIAALFATSIDFSAFSRSEDCPCEAIGMISGFIGIIITHLLFKNSGISVLAGLSTYVIAMLAVH